MTAAQGGAGSSWQYYAYDGTGQRIKRTVNGVETRQVYGIGGELIAEYSSTGALQKEYGYRNGQLLITAESGVALAVAPTGLTTAAASSSITLSWSAAAGATNYRIEHKGRGTGFDPVTPTSATSVSDNVTSGTAYLYRVCAADGSNNCTSSYSNIALGLAISFTDPNIVGVSENPASATTIKAAHITELRATVNAVRHLAGMSDGAWTYNPLVPQINVEDVRDLRTNLDAALTVLGIPTPAYQTDNNLVGYHENALQATPIKAAHIRELRARATAGTGGSGGAGSSFQIHWLVSDQLGTPRMIFDQSGSLANVSRHDYLPFGEELFAGTGGRTPAQGYPTGPGADGVRQQFTGQQRDNETGLDYFGARYYGSTQGRFTSPDPFAGSGKSVIPQSWNRYTYCLDNPLLFVDPNGLIWGTWNDDEGTHFEWFKNKEAMNASGHKGIEEYTKGYYDLNANVRIILNPDGPMGRAAAYSDAAMRWTNAGYAFFHGPVFGTPDEVAQGWKAVRTPEAERRYMASGAVEDDPVGNALLGAGFGGAFALTDAGISSIAGPSVRAMVSDAPASTPIGRSGSPLSLAGPDGAPWNSPGTVLGRQYSGHAFDSMQSRGIMPSAVENTIQFGQPSLGNQPNTTLNYDPVNNLTVVTNSTTGRVVTVRQGKP